MGLKNVVEYIDNHVVKKECRDKRQERAEPPPELFSVVPDLGF